MPLNVPHRIGLISTLLSANDVKHTEIQALTHKLQWFYSVMTSFNGIYTIIAILVLLTINMLLLLISLYIVGTP